MQFTKQQKIYAAVLGLAVGAFGFDRFVLGPPADAVDEVAAAPQPPRPPVRRVATQLTTPAVVGATTAGATTARASSAATHGAVPSTNLAARLRQVAAAQEIDLRSIGDAFRPSVAWVGAPKQAVPVAEPLDPARNFQNTHRLSAVMKQTGGGIAIIDNKTTLAVGQSIDGFRLVAVKDRSAVFRRGIDKVELRLPEEQSLVAGGLTPSGNGHGTANASATSEKVAGVDGRD